MGLVGCGGAAPTVEILEVTPEALVASDDAKDDLSVVVRYSDPDGDLGEGVAAIHDCRVDRLVTELAIPRIANADGVDHGVPIEGELTLVLADVGAVTAAAEPPAKCAELGATAPVGGAQVFCIVLIDAAGNESEGACTAAILVSP